MMEYVKSDLGLREEIRRYGRFDTNACLQCGTCTLSCDMSTDEASFPRRTIRYALLGLKEPLLSGLEPWLCYYCGDCSTACPRDADPAEGMMTLRRYLTAQYDWTGLAARIHRSRVWEVGALVTTGALFLVGMYIYHLRWVMMGWEDLKVMAEFVGMEHMFGGITLVTRLVFAAAAFFLLSNAIHMYWMTMRRGVQVKIPPSLYIKEAKIFVVQAVTQRRWRECSERRPWVLHLLLVLGCLLMFALVLFALDWFQTDQVHPIYHPQRLLGYLATIAMLVPLVAILIGRIRKRRQMHRYTGVTDWTLPIMLLLTVLSGLALHILRIMGLFVAAHYMYAAHMAITVALVLVEIPFGKWSHMLYRPLAVYFHAVKTRATQERGSEEGVLSHAS